MKDTSIQPIKTISEFHRLRGLPRPAHPLISVIDYSLVKNLKMNNDVRWMLHFYLIGLKKDLSSYLFYGQQSYDFESGVMSFMAPGQVLNIVVHDEEDHKASGTIILVHPDFLWNHPLAGEIKKHAYFGYDTKEALFLSDKEEIVVNGILKQIENEYMGNIDGFSQDIILAHLETLLTYADRFYNRQFITRKVANHELLGKLERVLEQHFEQQDHSSDGLPTVQQVSNALHVSPDYLTSMLKSLTGRTCQQHIHDAIISKAKEKLGTTTLSVSEVAYALGFEHVQSFSKLFKQKTERSPLAFRKALN